MCAAIRPGILSNKNKQIAILNWEYDEDKEIVRTINKGKSMFSTARFGLDETPYGRYAGLCFVLMYTQN